MKPRLFLVLIFAATLASARAQEDQPVHMRPEFSLVFPFVNVGRMVTVKYPVMINRTTVIKPGMQMRSCYMLNLNARDSAAASLMHSGTLEDTYARGSNAGGENKIPGITPEVAHEIQSYQRTVWEVPNNFVLFLAQFPTESSHLVFSPTARDSDIHDEMFHFFDGLFVGSPAGKVTVIAVEKESVAEKAGLKAGDEIESVGNYPTKGDLMTFAKAFASAKDDARENEASTYSMVLHGADGTTRTAALAMPLRIRGGLMDGFSEKP